ncbi:MAG: hypothetical protein JNJ47_06845 [Alphaproteobacteria bacterium]|nr:hypothetical protein [Alphaproteobacteria bacterium]
MSKKLLRTAALVSVFILSINTAGASSKKGFEDLTERPGTTIGTVVKTPGKEIVVIEKPYGKPATATVIPAGQPKGGNKK